MGIIRDLKNTRNLTEREKSICSYILEYPEKLLNMSARQLGEATYSSASAVVRLCQKLGMKGYPEFKIQYFSELKEMNPESYENIQRLSEQDRAIDLAVKVREMQNSAIEQTRNELQLPQLARVNQYIKEAQYIDFYGFDVNVAIASYACNQLLHAGKIAQTYVAYNEQEMMSLKKLDDHVAVIISHSGKNERLVSVAKNLHRQKTRTVLLTPKTEEDLAKYCDEVLYAAGRGYLEDFGNIQFTSSVKYLLDVFFCMAFTSQYEANMQVNSVYNEIWRDIL